MTLPIPVLDHVVVNALDRLDEVAALWERLGFTLTPRGHHTLGSENHLAVLGSDYIELLGVPPGPTNRTDVLDWPAGLNGIVFKDWDADGTHAALHEAGVPVLAPQSFSRPVDMPGGPRDAAFRTVRLQRDAVAAGRLFFCHHQTPELVWQGARRHANGVVGIAAALVAAADPAELLGLFVQMFGPDAVRDGALVAGLARVEVLTPAALRARLGDAAPDGDGRRQLMAALELRTVSLGRVDAALAAGHVPHTRATDSVTVAATDAGGVALAFRE